MKLGIFPLPIYLLPNGVTRLRIFEPRYKRLVKMASQEQGFVMSLYQGDNIYQSSKIGIWVDIIDFSLLDDGLLSIDVKAKELVKLSNFEIEHDKLRLADVEIIKHWSTLSSNSNPDSLFSRNKGVEENKEQRLKSALKKIFVQVPQLKALYPTTDFNNLYWVCARFIESLPLSLEKKQTFHAPESFEQCLEFLHTVINGEMFEAEL